jgi:hypothetical protein
MAGAVGVLVPSDGTDISKYQGSSELAPPNAHIPNVSPATVIVDAPPPLGVLQAVAVAGGGQKPTFAKAEIEAARNTSSRVSFRVKLSSFCFPSQEMSRSTQMPVRPLHVTVMAFSPIDPFSRCVRASTGVGSSVDPLKFATGYYCE